MTGYPASAGNAQRQESPELLAQVFEPPCLANQLLNATGVAFAVSGGWSQ